MKACNLEIDQDLYPIMAPFKRIANYGAYIDIHGFPDYARFLITPKGHYSAYITLSIQPSLPGNANIWNL